MLSSARSPPMPWAATGMFQQGVICRLMLAASTEGLICATFAVPGWPVPPAAARLPLPSRFSGALTRLGVCSTLRSRASKSLVRLLGRRRRRRLLGLGLAPWRPRPACPGLGFTGSAGFSGAGLGGSGLGGGGVPRRWLRGGGTGLGASALGSGGGGGGSGARLGGASAAGGGGGGGSGLGSGFGSTLGAGGGGAGVAACCGGSGAAAAGGALGGRGEGCGWPVSVTISTEIGVSSGGSSRPNARQGDDQRRQAAGGGWRRRRRSDPSRPFPQAPRAATRIGSWCRRRRRPRRGTVSSATLPKPARLIALDHRHDPAVVDALVAAHEDPRVRLAPDDRLQPRRQLVQRHRRVLDEHLALGVDRDAQRLVLARDRRAVAPAAGRP